MIEHVIKTGLASFGMSGIVFHAPLLSSHPGFKFAKVLERTKEKSKTLYPDAEIVRSYDELISDKQIELVVVNTPDNTHYDLTKKALEAGKHVVVEKPFTVTTDEAKKLIDIADRHKRLLSVFQNRRWDNDFLTVQKVIDNKLLGRLVEFESHFDRYRNHIQDSWKDQGSAGTGTIYNLGSHLIDQALVLFGIPEAVYADIRKLRDGAKVDDSYDVKLYYPQVKVTLKSSYLVRKPGPRFILHGTHGSFIKNGLDNQEQALKKGYKPDKTGWGSEDEPFWGNINTSIDGLHIKGKIETVPGNYLAYYQSVYESIIHRKKPAVPAQQGLDVINIIEKAIESSKFKKIVPV